MGSCLRQIEAHKQVNREFAKLKRRDMIRLACLAGLGLAIPLTELLKVGSSSAQQPKSQGSIKALGTTITIMVEEDSSPVKAQAAIEDALNVIREIELQLTRFQPSSPVYRLNQAGQLEAPTSKLLDVLDNARYFSERTNGVFDITVKPALDLLQRYLGGALLPSDTEFETAKKLIDFELISVSKADVRFEKPGMGITLDCLGKGYVLDMAAARLRKHGISSALVQGGGTLVAIGTRLDGSPWKIGVRDPQNPNGLIATISLNDRAVATSGDYQDFFSPDGSIYHIVDPATARSPLYSHSATVTAPTAHEADPLGVALMVKEPREGLRLLEGFSGCECLIATRDDRLVSSSHFGAIP
jgi:FAD:protein FMN transferase